MNKISKWMPLCLALMILGYQLGAQQGGFLESRQPQDMVFRENFLPLANSPASPGLMGESIYDRGIQIQVFPDLQVTLADTNRLEVFTLLPSQPEDAWILERESDGSFSRVTEITNLVDDATYGFYFSQRLTLTAAQVHSLIEGNWYEEVDFGASNYLGNLEIEYPLVNGPLSIPSVQPPLFRANMGNPEVIATNNHTARVVLDGSDSIDPFYLPMQYSWSSMYFWSQENFFTNTDVLVTNIFGLGTHAVRFQANDAIANGTPFLVFVEVITPGQAVNSLILDLSDSTLKQQQERILTGILSNAAAQFDRGQSRQACLELEYYLLVVKFFHLDSKQTSKFSQPAENVLDAFGFRGQ